MERHFLFLLGQPPLRGALARESLDELLTLAAFDQSVSVLFLDDGVFQLMQDMTAGPGESRGAANLWATLAFYGIEEVWVEQESLASRGLDVANLAIPVRTIARRDVPELICRHTAVLGAI